MTVTGVLLVVAFYAPQRLAPFLSCRGLFALALDGRLFIRGPALHLLKHAVLEHLLLQRLERGLDLIVENHDFQRGLRRVQRVIGLGDARSTGARRWVPRCRRCSAPRAASFPQRPRRRWWRMSGATPRWSRRRS